MKRLDLWKAKIKALKAAQKIKARELQAANRNVLRIGKMIVNIEKKVNDYLAKY